jgi:hypothetical protein
MAQITTRAPRCRMLVSDNHSTGHLHGVNRCESEAVADSDLCIAHLARAAADYSRLTSPYAQLAERMTA